MELIKEIWSSVVTTKCPRCKRNSPAFRKDGYTKMFVKPLSGRTKNTQDQRSKLGSEADGETAASKTGLSRKTDTIGEEEDLSEDEEQQQEERGLVDELDVEEDEEYKEGTSQKYISPTEVQDHIIKLWNRQEDMLNLMFGKFEQGSKQEMEVQSLGPKMFFLNYVVVPHTRFRPESEGGQGGRGGGGDKAFLHTHSAMLMKILTANTAMKDALLD